MLFLLFCSNVFCSSHLHAGGPVICAPQNEAGSVLVVRSSPRHVCFKEEDVPLSPQKHSLQGAERRCMSNGLVELANVTPAQLTRYSLEELLDMAGRTARLLVLAVRQRGSGSGEKK